MDQSSTQTQEILENIKDRSKQKLSEIKREIYDRIEIFFEQFESRFNSRLNEEIQYFNKVPQEEIFQALMNLKEQLKIKFDLLEGLAKHIEEFKIPTTFNAVDQIYKIPDQVFIKIKKYEIQKKNALAYFKCQFCEEDRIDGINAYRKHMITHDKILKYKCPDCSQLFQLPRGCAQHIFDNHPVGRSRFLYENGNGKTIRYYTCKFQKIQFQRPLDLAYHMRYDINYQSLQQILDPQKKLKLSQ